MWCRYNAVNFLTNIHKRHPIARPLGRGMGRLLWIQHLIDVLTQLLKLFMWYLTILDRVITALDCTYIYIYIGSCWLKCLLLNFAGFHWFCNNFTDWWHHPKWPSKSHEISRHFECKKCRVTRPVVSKHVSSMTLTQSTWALVQLWWHNQIRSYSTMVPSRVTWGKTPIGAKRPSRFSRIWRNKLTFW